MTAVAPFKPPKSLEELQSQLDKAFETDQVNVDQVHRIMSTYPGNKSDWKKFALTDKHKYTRNLVSSGNGKYNLIVLCWGEGHGSSIHDHTDSHCFMKILEGSIKESLYSWPEKEGQAMSLIRTEIYKQGQVAYINDSLGLHRVENTSHSDEAFTLHLYCPPFDFCAAFDEKSGKKFKCPVTFWSVDGKKTSCKKPESAVIPENN